MKQLTLSRDADFRRRCIEIFRRDCREGKALPSLMSVIERAIASQPHSHYVPFDLASARLHEIERVGLEKAITSPLLRQMWQEIAEQVQSTIGRGSCRTFDQALSFVLNFRRPSRFYISVDTARRILRPNLTYTLQIV